MEARSIQETTNSKNLLLLVTLRWVAVGGQVATILVVHFCLGIPLPLMAMGGVLLFLAILNVAMRRQALRFRPDRWDKGLQTV